MADTFSKKALQQKKAKKKRDKIERREERKNNNDKGKSLEDMMVYLDEYGNITDVPPEKQQSSKSREDDDLHIMMPGLDKEFTGVISLFFPDKGYGFIKEDKGRETVFVHSKNLLEPVVEKDRVTFEREKTSKGYAALNVRKLK